MLAAEHRLRTRREFQETVRRGRRRRAGTLVAHVHLASQPGSAPTRVGFVVGRSVGGSVLRHRVQRRLRAQVAPLVEQLPPGTMLVVRALPAAGAASSPELAHDLRTALQPLLESR